MIHPRFNRGVVQFLAYALLIGFANAQGPSPDPNKIRAGANVTMAEKKAKPENGAEKAKPSLSRDYPLSWTLLDENGTETKSTRFVVPPGEGLNLILKIANRGEAEEFRLTGAAIGVKGELPGPFRVAPGADVNIPIKLVKPDCSQPKGSINLNLYPVKTTERYRSFYKRIALECG